jgi:hypothetical protein
MKDIIKRLLSEELDRREILLFNKLNQKKSELKNKKNIIDYIEHLTKMLGMDPETAEYYYQLWKQNYRKEGDYGKIPKEDIITNKKMTPRTMSNTKVSVFAKARAPFKGSNLRGDWFEDGKGVEYYAIISYGWYPIYIFKEGVWYKVTDSYSSSTGRQISNANPINYDSDIEQEVIYVSRKEMGKLQDGATYDEIMRGKVEGLVKGKEDFISKRPRFAQDWGYGEDYTPIKVKFKITDIREEGDRAVIDVTIEDAGVRQKVPDKWGGENTTRRMVPSQGGYLRGEIPNVDKEKVERTITNRIVNNFKDYVGRWPLYRDGNYDLDPTKIRFNFIHEYEK